jgi:pimeloyl-ACP methyl ester carboxylesterase
MIPADRFVDLDGQRLHYLDWGESGQPAVLLLHGFNQTCHSWDEFAARLASEGLRAIALDQRGHGDSSRSTDYSREAMADDPVRLAESLGVERFVTVAMSMGAVHAVVGAVRHPARVRAVALVDWAPEVESHGVKAIMSMAELSWGSFDEAVDAMLKFNPRRSADNIRARLRHSLGRNDDGRWRWKVDSAGLLAHPRFREPSSSMWAVIDALACPTMLVRGGASDLLTSEVAERMAQRARAELVTIEGASHSVPGDRPDEFFAAVAPFVRAHARPA